MKRIIFAFLLLIASQVMTPLLVNASITSGNGAITGSWTVSLGFGGLGTETLIESFIVSDTGAGPFQANGIANVFPGTRVSATPNSNYAYMSGPSGVTAWGWDYQFAGNMADTISIDFLAWDNGVGSNLIFAATFDYIGGVFSNVQQSFGGPYDFLQDSTGMNYNRGGNGTVPEPGTIAIWSVFAITGLAFGNRRRKTT